MPTIDEMYGEYKICRRQLELRNFWNLYPECTGTQQEQLERRYDRETKPVRYLWVPFSWLPIGFDFEPIETLSGYTPICTKTSDTEGHGRTHMGQYVNMYAPDDYVRIFIPKE